MKIVSLFLKDSIYRLSPNTQTTKGAWKPLHSTIFLDKLINFRELGREVIEAIDKPLVIVPHPLNQNEWKESTKLWYKSMKIKSWKSFAKDAKSVEVYLEADKLKIVPTRNEQPKGFFTFLSEKSRFCPTDDPEALGRAIIDALNDCE